jgi:Bacterial Ig-like domain (group 1)/NHL repeat
MSRSIYKPLILIAFACLQAASPLWAQSFGPISTVAGTGIPGFSGDSGPATAARLSNPTDVAVHPNGDLYIADTYNHRVRRVDASGNITTFAGTGNVANTADGILASLADLNHPSGIAFDAAGNLYIADTDHDRIRRVDNATGIITTVAGTGVRGYNGDNQSATLANINSPYHIALDALGNLFIADDGNHRVRRVDATTGIITTVAGTGNAGYNGDNQPAASANLQNPRGVVSDGAGNLYIADYGNHRVRVVDPAGMIHTFAGNGLNGFSGDGAPATTASLKGPLGLGRDAAGNIYIADFLDQRVREVNIQTNVISTVAGNGQSGYSGDGGPATDASITDAAVTFDANGRMYIAEYGSDSVSDLDTFGLPSTITVVSGNGQSTPINTSFKDTLVVLVTDNRGHPVPFVPVHFTVPVSGASLASNTITDSVTNADGKVFVYAVANSLVGTYTVRGSALGVNLQATFNLTNTAGAPATIRFSQQPTDTSAGAVITPPVTVSLKDASNNPITGTPIVLTGDALQGGAPQNTNSSGVATFSNLKISLAGTHQLRATGGNLTANSSPFNITPGSQIIISDLSGGGQSAAVGASYAAPLKALALDTFDNPVAGVAVTFTAPSTGPSVTFSGSATVTTNLEGVATSPGMTANGLTGPFQVTATAPGASSVNPFTLANVAGASSRLAFVQQPTDTVAGVPMTPPVTVQLQDSFGNNVSTAGIAVTLKANPAAGGAGGLTAQPTANTDANGLATFTGLTFAQAGQFSLLAQANSVTSATSAAFTIRAGVPARLLATGGTPQSAAVLTPFAQQLQATVLDSLGNPVSGAIVVFGGPLLGGPGAQLSAPTAFTDANGHAAVTATANGFAGSYSMVAETEGVSVDVNFSLTNLAGAVGHVAFVQQPSSTPAGAVISPSVTLLVTDAGSNPVAGVSVTIHVAGFTAALGGTLTVITNSSGTATFADLSITVAGSYRLEALSSGMSASSNPFLITAASSPVAILAFQGDGQSAPLGTPYGGPLKARVEDLYHNPIVNAPVTFAAPTSGASVTFSGPTTVTSGIDGVAVSPAMTAISQTGTFQVTATTAAAPGPALFTLTNVPGAANKLAFVQQPVDTVAGAAITPAVTVQLQDSAGNAVHTAGILVTLEANAVVQRLKQLSGSTAQSTDTNGLATFATLSISQAGNYTLQASSTGLSSATSNSFKITAGPAAKIRTAGGTSQSATILTPFAQQLQVTVLDSLDNPVSGASVTFTAPGSGASATLSAPALTDANGTTAVMATANNTAGSYSVTAATGGVTPSASFSLTNVTGAVGHVAFVQQPSNTSAGAAISPPVTVQVTDAGSNPVVGVSVTIDVAGATAALGGTLTAITNATGMAAFADLSITVEGSYQLEAVSSGMSGVSASFQISPASSAVVILAFEGDGQSAAQGTVYSGPLQARVEDLYHNPIANASVTFTAPATGASVTFSGPATVTTGADGVAVSPAMIANSQTGTFQVTATTAAASGPALFNLTNVPGTANKLAFVQQPVDTVAGATITPAVTVQLQDNGGNAVHTAGVLVTLEANAAVQRLKQLSGSTAQSTDANGLATFATLSISQAGSYTLQATSTGLSSATSNSFKITVGTAASIQATGGTPQSTAILTPFTLALQATVLDANNNPVSGATVTFTAPATGASATLGAASAQTDSSGHATVTATANSVAGSYSVTAATGGAAVNASFSLTNVTGSIGQIAFVQHPSNTSAGAVISPPVTVRVVDAGSNSVVGVPVTIQVQGGSATLGGTLTAITNAGGVATFADLSINTAGTYQLVAVNGSTSAVSSQFQVSSSASSVVISVFDGDGQSAAVGTPYGGPLKAKVQDLYGNPLPGATVTFAAPASGASATFGGPVTVTTGADGIAVSPSITANSQTGTFQVSATTQNSTTPAVFNLTNVAGSANRLVFVQQPSDAFTGATISPPVTVQLQDGSGNSVHMAGVPVALQANAAVEKQLGGSTSQTTDANGLATFANLSTSQAGSYTLQATSSGLASATSNPFNITAGIPTSIAATGGTPQGAIVQTVFGVPLQATVTDSFGNPVSGVTVIFAAPSAGPSGLFGGQPTISVITDAQGRASAVITANSLPGSYGVTASSTAVTGSAVFSLTNLPPSASALAFVQPPGNTAAGQVIAPPITVQVVDGAGQPVNASGIPIFMSLSAGTGILSGSLVQLTNANGIATFSDLRISETGSKQLRASSEEQLPAYSNTFQITAGAPANIVVYSGSPQSTTVGQPFPEPLQALVTDALGFPLNGVPVTFTVPATGPGGTFSSSPVVVTGQNGIATTPALVANNVPGNFLVTATVAGVGGAAQFALTNIPQQTTVIVATPANLSFVQEVGQPIPPAQTVQISTTSQTSVSWTASASAGWLLTVPSGGSTPGQMVVSVNPAGLSVGVYTGSISITSASGGVSIVLVTYTINNKPTLVITPPVLAFTTTGNTVPPAPQNLQATSSSRSIAYTVSINVSTPPGGTWLKYAPANGQTIGTVTVTADPTGLPQGIYDGSVLFTPVESGINSVAVPVTLVVGCAQGGCILQPNITAVVNGASFHPTGAPGAIMTILGTNFSDAVYDGSATYPLPTVLGQTSVSVDGFPAPLYYVSPTQINFQMPSAVLTSGGNVVVNNGAAGFRASSSYKAALSIVDPGIFVTPDGRAAALNGDLTPHTSATPIPAGGYVILYLTGHGPVTPAVEDGTAAPAGPLSIINAPVTVTIGSMNAQVTYQGLAPGFAGLAQLNVIVPAGLPPGNQPVSITINGDSSNVGLITVK